MSFRCILFLVVSVATTSSQYALAQNQTVHVQKRDGREPLRYLLYAPVVK